MTLKNIIGIIGLTGALMTSPINAYDQSDSLKTEKKKQQKLEKILDVITTTYENYYKDLDKLENPTKKEAFNAFEEHIPIMGNKIARLSRNVPAFKKLTKKKEINQIEFFDSINDYLNQHNYFFMSEIRTTVINNNSINVWDGYLAEIDHKKSYDVKIDTLEFIINELHLKNSIIKPYEYLGDGSMGTAGWSKDNNTYFDLDVIDANAKLAWRDLTMKLPEFGEVVNQDFFEILSDSLIRQETKTMYPNKNLKDLNKEEFIKNYTKKAINSLRIHEISHAKDNQLYYLNNFNYANLSETEKKTKSVNGEIRAALNQMINANREYSDLAQIINWTNNHNMASQYYKAGDKILTDFINIIYHHNELFPTININKESEDPTTDIFKQLPQLKRNDISNLAIILYNTKFKN